MFNCCISVAPSVLTTEGNSGSAESLYHTAVFVSYKLSTYPPILFLLLFSIFFPDVVNFTMSYCKIK